MLYLWMPEANGVWQWTQGDVWTSADSLEQLIQDTQLMHGQEATVFFPSRHVQLLQQAMPKIQYKKMGQDAVKYLLEEYVTLPVDVMKVLHHFDQDQLTVIGLAKSTVETFEHALHLLPFKVTALLPDFMLVPVPKEQQVSIVASGGQLLVRESEYVGYSIDDLALYLDFKQNDLQFSVSGLSNEQLQHLEAFATQDQIESFQYTFPSLKKPKQHIWNVLPKAKSEQKVSGYWKACAGVLLSVLVLQLSYDAVRGYHYNKLANQTSSQAVDQFKSWFGQSYPVTEQNLKSQFEAQLRQNQVGSTQAFDLLSRVGPVLMQERILAKRVSFENAVLKMELSANSSETLTALTRQLGQQGFKVKLGNIQASGTGAVGLVSIQ